MDQEGARGRSVVIGSLLAILLCALLVTLCYFFVDRQVAWFVHDQVPHWRALVWPTLLPPWLARLAPLVAAVAAAAWLWRPDRQWPRPLLALSLSLIVAVAIKEQLKWCFGRYWPETWIQNNPSLIQDGAYGFHPFHDGIAYESFPSGHTTIMFSLIAVAWLLWPRWRWLWPLPGLIVVAGLVGMNYHFIGDTVAGAFVGSMTGVYTVSMLHFRKFLESSR